MDRMMHTFNRVLLGIRKFRFPAMVFGLPLFRLVLMLVLPFTKHFEYRRYLPIVADTHYDFIVVGAGSSGSVVGARLSQTKNFKVLLLEAGGIPGPESVVPGINVFTYVTDDDWNYAMSPQKYSHFGYRNKMSRYPRGKGLGGSSNTNFMMYVRGNRRDYDSWSAIGNAGWDYGSVLPFFKRSEDYGGEINPSNGAFRSRGGPLGVEPKQFGTRCGKSLLEAGWELGYPSGIDPNAQEQIGFTIPDLTVRNGIRASTAEAFLKPNLRRPNFHILTYATVSQIIIDEYHRAIGVRYFHKNQWKVAYASKEVILSAGAVDSPKILMLSGIGPRDHLESFQIPLKVDLPGVGQNFHDHALLHGLIWRVDRGAAYSERTAMLNISAGIDYVINRNGPFAVPFAVEANVYAQVSGGDELYPDAQILMMSVTPALDFGFMAGSVIGFTKELYDDYFPDLFKTENFMLAPVVLRPKSRGSITLRSRNPFQQANIDPNYLSDPEDVEIYVRAIKLSLKIGETFAMKKIGARLHRKPLLGCKHFLFGSDDYWRCFTRHMASTIYHAAGSCKMAPPDDPLGVVDNELRVRGVEGLRVIDASIMPWIASGNTNAPSIMIGERGVDFILRKYLKNYP